MAFILKENWKVKLGTMGGGGVYSENGNSGQWRGQLTMFPSITSPCHSPGTLCFCPTLVFPFALLLLARPPPIGWNFGHCSILITMTPPHPTLPFLLNVDWFLAWHIYKLEQRCDMNFAVFNVLFSEQSGLPQGKGNKKSDNFSKIFFPNDKNYQDFFSATSPSQMAQYYCGVSIANKWIWNKF